MTVMYAGHSKACQIPLYWAVHSSLSLQIRQGPQPPLGAAGRARRLTTTAAACSLAPPWKILCGAWQDRQTRPEARSGLQSKSQGGPRMWLRRRETLQQTQNNDQISRMSRAIYYGFDFLVTWVFSFSALGNLHPKLKRLSTCMAVRFRPCSYRCEWERARRQISYRLLPPSCCCPLQPSRCRRGHETGPQLRFPPARWTPEVASKHRCAANRNKSWKLTLRLYWRILLLLRLISARKNGKCRYVHVALGSEDLLILPETAPWRIPTCRVEGYNEHITWICVHYLDTAIVKV